MARTPQLNTRTRIVGWLWMLIVVPLAIYTIKSSDFSSTLEQVHGVFVALLCIPGMVAVVATSLRFRWGAQVLLVLAWIGIIYCAGWGLWGVAAGLADQTILGSALFAGFISVPIMIFGGFVIALSLGLHSSMHPSLNSRPPSTSAEST